MVKTIGAETGIISPTGQRIADDTEQARKQEQADIYSAASLLSDAVLQMKQGGKLNADFYGRDGLAMIVSAGKDLGQRITASEAGIDDDPELQKALTRYSLMKHGGATAEEADEILAAYERSLQPPELSSVDKMSALGATVLAAEEVTLKPPQPLSSAAEIMSEAWQLPLTTWIEMPGLDSAARHYIEGERAQERADAENRTMDAIVRNRGRLRGGASMAE